MSKILDFNKHGAVGEYIKDNTNSKSSLNIVSPIFTIFAFDELKDVLNKTEKVNFLFNEPTFVKKLFTNKKEVKEFTLEMKKREQSLSEFPLEIKLKNNLDQNQIASQVHDFIQDKMEVKSAIDRQTIHLNAISILNNKQNMHLITGKSIEFSKSGLGYSNQKSFDFIQANTDIETNEHFLRFFNNIWNDESLVVDVKETLLEHVINLYKENSPELVYYLTLYYLFNDELINMDEMARIKERTGFLDSKVWNMLYNFQQDAVIGAIKKLELYNGCIIADSVGLGKTFEALGIIKYYELRNDRVLVLAPKKLRSNWTSFRANSKTNPLAEDRFRYDVLNHTDLSREYGKSGDIDLATLNWGNYDLVVIDESHNFRNNPAVKDRQTRYQKLMEDIIKSGVKTKVLMLSATPVNNRFKDLRNQIMFITEGKDDAFNDNVGIKSIDNTLRQAQRNFNDWGNLAIEEQTTENLLPTLEYDFFNLLNTVTIARSRKHIQKYYDTKDIGDFPERLKPISIKSDIDTNNKFPNLDEIKLYRKLISQYIHL